MSTGSLLRTAAVACAIAISAGCHTLDDDRIPAMAVNIAFPTVAEWNIYGVNAALDYRYFIPERKLPTGFFYTASTYTGFGGVLLLCDVLGNPLAYDLACPVECKSTTRVAIDKESDLAVCPVCGSSYDVFSLYGHPTGGIAAERGYGLRRYRVIPGQSVYMQVTF